jgi:hypothetical protein
MNRVAGGVRRTHLPVSETTSGIHEQNKNKYVAKAEVSVDNRKALSKTTSNDKSGSLSEPVNIREQLNTKEIQRSTFEGLKAAWGSKEGDENYNASYDFDANGVINIQDWPHFLEKLQSSFQEFKQAFGSNTGETAFNVNYDYNRDGTVNIQDWPHFLKQWTA